ncbi:hypothetical protein [Paenibacillus koleovorans]|uniref:hypothetical protein n=1 Tax=Paenibacillus koleovorans TaxID=121608 RepID=UPI000FD930BF|nr:hypothetical protein [Paenibacillus koleovorans]
MNDTLRLGTAKVEITPKEPVPLAGFGFRHGNYEGITRPLHARISVFEQKYGEGAESEVRRLALIQADLIALEADVIPEVAEALRSRWGLAGADVLYCASHSHSGPHMRGGVMASRIDKNYASFVAERVLGGLEAAFGNLEPVSVEKGVGRCSIGIHRRKQVDGRCVMAPNPEGPNDQEVTVIQYRRVRDGSPKGVHVHFTCHPTTTGDNLINSEYPGVAMETVEAGVRNVSDGDVSGNEVVATFLQGCCGDIRPNLTGADGGFFRGDDTDVARFGDELGKAVMDVLDRPMQPLRSGVLASRETTIDLPCEPVLNDSGAMAAGSVPMRLVYWRLAEGLTLLAMNGEVVVEYGNYLKQKFPGGVLPLGYTNGVIAYIPTAEQLREGGYEPIESIPLFGLSSPFRPELEPMIKQTAAGLVQGASIDG